MLPGEVINERDRCSQCKGQMVVQEKKVLEVHVEKGMKHGQKIVFPGKADEAVSWTPDFENFYTFFYLLMSLNLS